MNINVKSLTASALGEMLRDKCFGNRYEQGLGCYENYKLINEFHEVPRSSQDFVYYSWMIDTVVPMRNGRTWCVEPFESWTSHENDIEFVLKTSNVYSNGDVIVAFSFDGDACLLFHMLDEDIIVVNDDAKKDYTWNFLEL